MANPRKFSEKIALHNQKQAEETAAFNQILQEVSHVIARVNPPLPKQHLHVNQSLGTYRGGSLPNVNHIGSNSIDLKGALTNLEEINAEGAVGGISGDGGGGAGSGSSPSGGAPSPAASRREGGSSGGGSQGRTSNQGAQERGRSMGVGPMRGSRPGGGNRIDTSPYGSAAYLSPPQATDASSWRRTNSDSALHHSAMSGAGGGGQGGSNVGIDTLHLVQGSPRRAMDGQYLGGFSGSSGGVEGGGAAGPCDPGGGGRNLLLSSALSSQLCDGGGRPRSCCDVPRVPGINIYPTSSQQEPGTLQIPSGNNTGSLPDLTNFHFPSPLPTPLDIEDHNSSSPYSSTSPQGGTSPTTLSPTSGGLSSSPRQHQGARFSFGQASSSPPSPIPVPQGGLSPGHSPTPNHRQPQQPPNMGSNLSHSPNHLSVPSLVNSSFLHSCKGLTFDNSSNMQMDSFQQNRYMYQPQPSNQPQHQLHHRQQQSQCSPPLLSNSQSIPTQHLSSLSSYRSPHLNRPSPQSSPGLTVPSSPLGGYRSTSPVGRASPHSAPQSPVSPASSLGTGNQSSAALSNMSSHQHRHSTSSPSPSSPSPSPSSSSSTSAITTNSSSASQEQQSNYYLVQNFEQFSMMDNPVSTSNDFIGSQSSSMHYSLTSPSMSMVGSPDDGGGGIDSVNLACLGLEMGLGLGCGNTIGRVPHQDATNNGGMGQVTDGGYYSHRQSPSSPSSIAMDPTRQSQQQQQHHHQHPHQQSHHQNQQHLQFGVGIRQLPSILSQPPPQPLDPIGGGGGGGGGGLSESGHHTAPQTPNSPTSIPDIILTDFSSGAGDDISATKDLSRVLAAGGAPGIIEEEDLSPYLFDADALRQDLGPLDSDGLQMLTAPDMNSITDPATEDHFRHDRL